MEAAGVYWKPVYCALEDSFAELWLCNAQHVKNVPGCKTDLSDAEWLADVASRGMVRASLVPPRDPRAAGVDALSQAAVRYPYSGDPATREGPPRRGDQVELDPETTD